MRNTKYLLILTLIIVLTVIYSNVSVAERHNFLVIGESNLSNRSDYPWPHEIQNLNKIFIYNHGWIQEKLTVNLDAIYFIADKMLPLLKIEDEIGIIPCKNYTASIINVKNSECYQNGIKAGNIKGVLIYNKNINNHEIQADEFKNNTLDRASDFSTIVGAYVPAIGYDMPSIFKRFNKLSTFKYNYFVILRSETGKLYGFSI